MFSLQPNKKHIWQITLFSICLFFMVVPLAFAQDATKQTSDFGGISGFMYDIFITIGGAFLWLGGQLMDIAITELVIGMSAFLKENGTQLAINSLWVIVRDLFNIAFIFGLIYIGFKTILGTDESGTRRWLISLIGAALLINFSLYFTQVVVDFSNVAATQVYNLITVTDDNGNPAGISEAFMELTRISTYTSANQNQVLEDTIAETTGSSGFMRFIVFGFLMMCFMLVTAFVFAAGAFMLIARFVILVLCMIFSPALFLGWVYPGMSKYTKTWVNMLLKNAFLAPAFLFMIYLSLIITQKLAVQGVFAKAFTANSAIGGGFDLFLSFFIIIGFMIGSLVVAKKMGAVGASQSINIGNSMRRQAMGYAGRAAGGITFGSAAWIGRRGIGSAGAAVAKSQRVQRLAKRGGLAGWAGRQTMLASDKVAEASFDARRVGGVGKKLGLGEGKKGGFKQDVKDTVAKEKKIASMLGPDERVYSDLGVEDILNDYKEAGKKRSEAIAELSKTSDQEARKNLQVKIKTIEEEIKIAEKAHTLKSVPASVQAKIDDPNVAFSNTDWERMKTFSAAHVLAKNLPKEEYAVNLENRWATDGGRDMNKAAADAIRKDNKKSDNDKLIDAIKSSGS